MPKATEPLAGVWRTPDRLHTDEATVEMLVALAADDDAIGNVIADLEAAAPGNGSVWASGRARGGGRPALLKMGAPASERDWMTAIDRTKADIVPSVSGPASCAALAGWYSSNALPSSIGGRPPMPLPS